MDRKNRLEIKCLKFNQLYEDGDIMYQIKALSQLNYADWLVLWQAYQAFYGVNLAISINEQTWQRLIATDYTHMYGFAACQDEQILGIVHVIEHDSCWTSQPYAYLQDLYVLDTARGNGIAKLLIQYVQQHCHAHCDRVYWLTHESNVAARHVYDQVAKQTGFIQYRLPVQANI